MKTFILAIKKSLIIIKIIIFNGKNLNISYMYIFKNQKFIISSCTHVFQFIHSNIRHWSFILQTISFYTLLWIDIFIISILHNLSLFISLSTVYDEATSDIVYMHHATSLSIQIKFTSEYALSPISLHTRFTCHIFFFF